MNIDRGFDMANKLTGTKTDGSPKGLSIQGFVEASFKVLDLNLDGAITRTEVIDLLGPATKAPMVAFVVNQIIRRFDGNKDGFIVEQEMFGVLNRLDMDQNGVLTTPEIRAASIELVGFLGSMVPTEI